MRKKIVSLTVALVALAGTAFAQTVPTILTVSLAKTKIVWTWTKGTGDYAGEVEQFVMKCGSATGSYTLSYTINSPTARQVNLNKVITAPGVYYCVVTAKNKFTESANSNEVHFEAGYSPATPSSFQLVVTE